MGIKDQFQDKANQLAEKAKAAAAGHQDEASERASQAADQAKDKARDTFDENFDK
ncbi:hypothetical protein [Streptomyces sp. NBC_00503]|uniref:hypothetical protein n=1 Tax=Streptomyces sp. NBC_00503 TaxID=2903659 RepID=UPI002E80B7BB|nr:hypothetical protein [Streptomyces sp. NBC_00503]WUD81727.1 hypothetical protein OG490_14960 [Streptomyces sp. NBC_00503]